MYKEVTKEENIKKCIKGRRVLNVPWCLGVLVAEESNTTNTPGH
jgi:hypothetical protein